MVKYRKFKLKLPSSLSQDLDFHSQGSPQPPITVPVKPGLPTAPQYSTSEARAPHSPQHSTSKARVPHSLPAHYQQSQGSPQPPSTVPVKPGLPIAPSTVPAKPGLPTTPQHSTSKARAPYSPAQYQQSQGSHSPPVQYQPPGTITGTACLSPVPEEAPSHQGPSQGLPASLQHQKKLPATRDHHRDCLPLPSTRRSSQPPQGLPVINEHSLDIYTFKLETS